MNVGRALCFALGALAFAAPAVAQDLRNDAEELARRNAILLRRLELARGDAPVKAGKPRPGEGEKDFYLLLDPNEGRLILMLRNAVLRDWKILKLEQGTPEVFFRSRRPDSEWQGVIFRDGRLDPPRELDRVVMDAPPPSDDGAEVDVRVPPTPEEMYPVPSRYHVRFAGNLSLEVRTGDADPSLNWRARLTTRLQHWWEDARAALGGGENPDVVRLRLVMAPDEAKALFRALPPDTKLLVIPKA